MLVGMAAVDLTVEGSCFDRKMVFGILAIPAASAVSWTMEVGRRTSARLKWKRPRTRSTLRGRRTRSTVISCSETTDGYGYGTCTYANGDVYVGEWTGDEKNGEGTMECAMLRQCWVYECAYCAVTEKGFIVE